MTEITRDMASAYSLGCADAMPGAARTVDRFHVTQLLTRALDRTRCAEARSCEEKRRPLRGTKYVWLKRPENLMEEQAAKRASLPPSTCSRRGRARWSRRSGPSTRTTRGRRPPPSSTGRSPG